MLAKVNMNRRNLDLFRVIGSKHGGRRVKHLPVHTLPFIQPTLTNCSGQDNLSDLSSSKQKKHLFVDIRARVTERRCLVFTDLCSTDRILG